MFKTTVLLFLLITFFQFKVYVFSQDCDVTLKAPSELKEYEKNIPTQVDIKKISSFTNFLKPDISSGSLIPLDTRLRLQASNYISTKSSKVGEYFRAKVLEDLYLPTTPSVLLIPKGSWVRGRISHIKRPTLFNMSGQVSLHLHQIVTPIGEVNTLDAVLSVEKGIPNLEGLLDPVELLPDTAPNKTVYVSSLDETIISKLVSGFLLALVFVENLNNINIGQELQIVLKKDIRFTKDL